MKKLLLGLGTLSLTALSVLTIVSCGGTNDGGTTKPDPETTTDLKITAKPSPQSTIDKAITDFNGATTDTDKITALQTVFGEITAEKFKHFDVKATATSENTPGTIVLTAKSGFAFGTSKTLSSSSYIDETIDLKITSKPVLQSVITAAIVSIEHTSTTANKITELSTVFNGITWDNINNFDVSFLGANPDRQILLTAKEGYSFGGNITLSSSVAPKIDLGITATPKTQTIINEAVDRSTAPGATDSQKIAALQTVFDGVTEANFQNFNFQIGGGITNPFYFYLAAKEGFSFGGQQNLTSIVKEPIKLPISRQLAFNQGKIDTATRLISGDGATTESIVGALGLVFDGVTIENFENITVELSSPGGVKRIVLIAKEGYSFSKGETSISSDAISSDFIKHDTWM